MKNKKKVNDQLDEKLKSFNKKTVDFSMSRYDEFSEDIVKVNEEARIIVSKIPNRIYPKGEFFVMNFSIVSYFLKNNLTALEIKVFAVLLDNINEKNLIVPITQKRIAEILETTQPRVSEAMKKLEKTKMIIKKDNLYYFNKKFLVFEGRKSKKFTED